MEAFPMRTAVAVLLACVFPLAAAAQMKPQTPSRPPITVSGARTTAAANFPRISQADALKLYREGKAVFVDVRSNGQFSLGHIKGAMSIPGSQIVRRFSEVPVRKTVITYCACSAEQSSGRAAASLIAHGVKNVFALKGGWDEWKGNGNPTATGPK
jgi:rhodanese-related sulfurtransferase